MQETVIARLTAQLFIHVAMLASLPPTMKHIIDGESFAIRGVIGDDASCALICARTSLSVLSDLSRAFVLTLAMEPLAMLG